MKKEKKEIKEDNNKQEENTGHWLSVGMCLGISIGTAIGAATNNIGLWLPIGLSIGLCFGLALSNNKDNNDKK